MFSIFFETKYFPLLAPPRISSKFDESDPVEKDRNKHGQD